MCIIIDSIYWFVTVYMFFSACAKRRSACAKLQFWNHSAGKMQGSTFYVAAVSISSKLDWNSLDRPPLTPRNLENFPWIWNFITPTPNGLKILRWADEGSGFLKSKGLHWADRKTRVKPNQPSHASIVLWIPISIREYTSTIEIEII